MMFNKKQAKVWATMHLVVTLFLVAYALIDWFYINPELRRAGGVPMPLLLLGGAYFVADFPVTILYVLYWTMLKMPYSVFDVWWMPIFVYSVLGTLWWYVLGGNVEKWMGMIKRNK